MNYPIKHKLLMVIIAIIIRIVLAIVFDNSNFSCDLNYNGNISISNR